MKCMRCYLLCTVLLLMGPAMGFGQQKLSFNGYYVSLPDSTNLSPFKYYLRFYPDGTVIGVNTAGKPENLLLWFKKENATPYKGKYALRDSSIDFAMTSEQGEVEYHGKLTPDNTLVLMVKSLINKYEGKEEYNFMQLDKIK